MLKDVLSITRKSELKEALMEMHAHDIALSFFDLTDDEKIIFFKSITDEKLAETVSYMDIDDAADVMAAFDIEKQKRLIEMMEPDDAADVILELDDDTQEELIELLGESSDIVQLIKYEENETGSAMTSSIIKINQSLNIKQATKKVIKEARDVESIQTIFVTDDEERFIGIIPLRRLLKASAEDALETLIESSLFVYDKDSIEKTVDIISDYDIYELAVVDENQHLLGMITLDDALDIYQEEAQEDFEKLAALPETDEDQKAFKTALHRLPWLILLLIISIPIAMVTSMFEEVIAAVAILVIFQPLMLDSAGNVATQTLAVTLMMLSSEEKGFKKNALREIITGILIGLMIGFIAAATTYIFSMINPSLADHPLLISSVVGLSLWLTVMLAPIIAIMIPVILKKLKQDPAVASGPFITTIIDIAALCIYFGLATLMLGGIA